MRRWSLFLLRATLYLLLLGPLVAFGLYGLSTRWFYPQLLPSEWTFEPLMRQLGSPQIQAALAKSLVIAGLVTSLALLIGLPAARTLGLRRFRGRSLVLLLMFLPTVVPPLATGMGLNILFLQLGLAGSVAGVVLVHLVPVLPYTIFALLGVFARYDEGYEQQARTLGASWPLVLLRVTLPLAGPGLAVAALFAFLVSWSQYVLTLLIGGGRVVTLPLLLFNFVSAGRNDVSGAIGIIYILPGILILLLTARHLSGRSGAVGGFGRV